MKKEMEILRIKHTSLFFVLSFPDQSSIMAFMSFIEKPLSSDFDVRGGKSPKTDCDFCLSFCSSVFVATLLLDIELFLWFSFNLLSLTGVKVSKSISRVSFGATFPKFDSLELLLCDVGNGESSFGESFKFIGPSDKLSDSLQKILI